LNRNKNEKMKKKNFDSVKLMRSIREKLTKRYLQNPDLETSDLEKIRRKYKLKQKSKHNSAA